MTGPQAGPAAGAVPLKTVAMNLLGVVEHPALGDSPYRVSQDGRPYLPAGDGGIVLGLELGDSVFALDADHAAPGACLVHPDPAARFALTTYSCIGNEVVVRSGAATGAQGFVIGKRGEAGRVITAFRQADLRRLRPGDQVSVRASGQGGRPAGFPAEVSVMNIDAAALAGLPVRGGSDPAGAASPAGAAAVTAGVRLEVPGRLAGNGIGRPSAGWDLDLQLGPDGPGASAGLRLGDLVAVTDLDTRYNMGYRRGWVTVGVVVHGASPLPGHGPGITPILTGPGTALRVTPDAAGHAGLTLSGLKLQ